MTLDEILTLELGFVVQQEQEQDAAAAQVGGSTETERTKREHKQSIRRRLKQQ